MVKVRTATAADVAAVVLIERGAVEAPHWGEAEYRGALEAASGVRRCLLVAEVEGRLVGFAVGTAAAGVGELESVAVAEAARRQRVGRALCVAVMEWCRGQGAGSVELEVRAGSLGAIGLYTGLGFVASGRRRGYYRDPVEDALLMQMELRD
jgi:[ribosomal protein S18]-alanine N-acetyltransferase